jgi:hypothetical protein
MKTTAIAYLAGLVDGEGCITINCGKGTRYYGGTHYNLRLEIGMTHRETIEWVRDTFGLSMRPGAKGYKGTKQKFTVCANGPKALSLILMVSPYLITKSKHVEVAKEFQRCFADTIKGKRLTEQQLAERHRLHLVMKSLNLRKTRFH